ncbi:MAG: efflux RND transporter periplasmic adaptor subunit [Bacteroidota bacterium]
MRTRKTVLALAAIVAVVLGAALFMALTSGQTQADASKASAPVAVEVMPVTQTDLTETVSAVGTIAAMKDVVVSSETAGRIVAVPVRVGDHVRRGQTLIQVDDELKAIAVEQARAQLQAAETNLKKARRDFERAESLSESGDIADVELEAYRLAYHSSEAQHTAATAALRLAQRQYDDTRIKAPIAGIVASRKVEVGEMVSPGREVANIVDISTVKVKLSIPEEEVGKLRLGQPATLSVDARPGELITGTVYTIGAKTETPTGHSYPVEVIVQNKDLAQLKVGMFARTDIQARSQKGALAITKESLVDADSHPAVFVVENGVARLRPVTLGIRAGDRYQVLNGLTAGELVVSFGQQSLKDGSAVQYK